MNIFARFLMVSACSLAISCGGGGATSPATSTTSVMTTTTGGGTVTQPTVTSGSVSEGAADFSSSISTPGLLMLNDSVTGTIDRTGDLDGFRLIITETQTVRITITGITLQETGLSLVDDTGGAVAVDGQPLTSVGGQLMAANPSPTQFIEVTLAPATYIVLAGTPLGSDDTGTYEVSASVVSLGGDPDSLTVTGVVSKGILANAPVTFYAVVLDENDTVVTLGETVTDSQGRYEAVISRELAGDAFYVASTLSGATTICDAPLGCADTAFGDMFTYADDGVAPDSILLTPLEVLRNGNILAAPVATPLTASTVNRNVNLLTTMVFANIDIEQEGFASSFAVVSVAQLTAAARVSELFGIGNGGDFDIPFVDITQPITETDSEAVKAAILAGGMQSVMAEGVPDQIYSAFIRDLLNNGGDFLIREGTPTNATVSLEDIYLAALEIENVNQSTSNAYLSALDSLRDDLVLIQAAAADSRTVEGEIP